MKHEGSASSTFVASLDAPARRKLRRYAELLGEVAVPNGMISRGDADRIWSRHVLDGLRGAALIPRRAHRVADLGSGAGIPGVPVAIARPELSLTLCESRRDRAGFIELVVAELDLGNVVVHPGRVQGLPTATFDACLARAFRPPAACWQLAERLLVPSGILLYWAGRGTQVEIAGIRTRSISTASLANAGPIVMMATQ